MRTVGKRGVRSTLTRRRAPWTALKDIEPLAIWRTVPPGWATEGHVASALAAAVTVAREALSRTSREAEGNRAKLEQALALAETRSAAGLLDLSVLTAGFYSFASADIAECGLELDRRLDDHAASCFWLAVRFGHRYARIPLLGALGRLPAACRRPWHADLLQELAERMPDHGAIRAAAEEVGLGKALWQQEAEAARPDQAKPDVELPEAADKDGETVSVLPAGTAEDALPRESRRRLARLLKPLPLKPWPAADELSARLLEEFPWAGDAIGRIAGDLRLAQATRGRAFSIRPLALVGPPGSGKSRLLTRLLDLLRETDGPGGVLFPLAGSSDNRILAGTPRGWSSENPSLATTQVLVHGCANPAIMLDELDKIGGSARNGDPAMTLLTALEPTTARRWLDEGVGLPVDLRHVTWLATANDWNRIPALLRTRLRRVDVPLPRPEDFEAIVVGVLADTLAELGCDPLAMPEVPQPVLQTIELAYRRGRLSARAVSRAIRRALEAAAAAEVRATRH